MKKILITGANSYIGTSFENYMKQFADEYQVDTVDMTDKDWILRKFSNYGTVFHVAGIAHIKETKENEAMYYKINRDLAIEAAKKAKADGVKQFIFLSSMSVYGMDTGIITCETIHNPKTHYGKSKLEAEIALKELHNESFFISIVRPPMVYGKGCKGNYQTLRKFALISPFFPDIKNKRSMIYIDNLSFFIKKLIDESLTSAIYYPQNAEYTCTTDMVSIINNANNKKIIINKLFNILVKFLPSRLKNKIFYDLYYDIDNDRIYKTNFYESIIKSEE